jgi:hypothetical protein
MVFLVLFRFQGIVADAHLPRVPLRGIVALLTGMAANSPAIEAGSSPNR